MAARKRAKKKTSDALVILDRITGKSTAIRRLIKEAELNYRIAHLIYDARTSARLSQAQLARLVGTTQSAISRLEDADYDGHSLSMLQRIAAALHKRIEIRFVSNAG